MKKLHVTIILILISTRSFSQTFDWVKSIGGTSDEVGTSIAVDDAGNVYTAGYFRGTVDFDPGPAIFNLTAEVGNNYYESTDIFFTKMDKDGILIWAKQIDYYRGNFGGINNEYASNLVKISLDRLGNIYTSGSYRNTIDIDPNPSNTLNFTSSGNTDFYILKMNNEGNLLWAKTYGGPEEDSAYSLTIDNENNPIITGYFAGGIDFDTESLTDIRTSVGYSDIFITKLNAAGKTLWTKTYGTSYLDSGIAITIDNENNIYSVGSFSPQNNFNFNPTNPLDELIGYGNHYLLKLDKNGNHIFSKYINEFITQINSNWLKVDLDQNIYFAGMIAGLDWYGNNFVKYDKNGEFVYHKYFSDVNPPPQIDPYDSNFDLQLQFNLDALGNAYVIEGPDLYDWETQYFSELPEKLKKVNKNGSIINISNLANVNGPRTNDIFIDKVGNIYTIGTFSGTVDFNPPTAGAKVSFDQSSTITSMGNNDVFVQKFSAGPLPVNLINFSVNNSENSNLISWETTSEINAQQFDIQRSNDAKQFETLGTVNAKGNSNESIKYSFEDIAPANGINYYRLKQIDIDGKSIFSRVISIKNVKNEFLIFPNPTDGLININANENFSNATLSVFDLSGKLIFKKENINSKFELVDLKQYQDGVYVLQIFEKGKVRKSKFTLIK